MPPYLDRFLAQFGRKKGPQMVRNTRMHVCMSLVKGFQGKAHHMAEGRVEGAIGSGDM